MNVLFKLRCHLTGLRCFPQKQVLFTPRSFRPLLAAWLVLACPGFLRAQFTCTWAQQSFDSFEYTTPVPDLLPNTVYHVTPIFSTVAPCAHAGNRGLYLNFIDGFTGVFYTRTYRVCIGARYRFSFWTRDTWGGVNNLTFRVLDPNGVVLSTQNVINNGVWQNVVMPEFVAATSDVRFQAVTNMAGGGSNDAALDELMLEVCHPTHRQNVSVCNVAGGSMNLYGRLPSPSHGGGWTGPSVLGNGHWGTFVQGTHANGEYTYTIDGGTCPDSLFIIQLQSNPAPDIHLPQTAVVSCGPYTLPPITGTGLTGNPGYFTGPGGTGTALAVGSQVTAPQTVYLYNATPLCNDEDTLLITVSTPVSAGNDNGAGYCGPGPLLDLDNLLSAGVPATGTWAETTNPPSGSFTPATGQWATANLAVGGTYTFSYTVAANGACPADTARFTLSLGNMAPVRLGNDTALCQGAVLALSAGPGYDTYSWDNGSTTSARSVNAAGTYWVRATTLGPNQIVNGDFEQGNTNFMTQYVSGTAGSWGLLTAAGTYAVVSNPNSVHTDFAACADHTPAPGSRQMVVNGSNVPNTRVWCQTVPIQPGTEYRFGTWVSSALTAPEVAQLQFSINNVALGNIFSPTPQGCNWQQFAQTWQSGTVTNAEICIVNQNTLAGGNDFLLDDISFRPVCHSTDTIVVTYVPSPTVNLGPDTTYCAGTAVSLDAQNATADHLWSTGETTQTISPAATGNYWVRVTIAEGCVASDSVRVTFEEMKQAGGDSSVIICSSQNQFGLGTYLSAGASAGGTWHVGQPEYTGVIAPGGSVTAVPGTFGFDYVVTGTACPADTATITVRINRQPVAASDQTLHFCASAAQTVDLTPHLNHPWAPIPPVWVTGPGFPAGNLNAAGTSLDLAGLGHGNYELFHVLAADTTCTPDTMKLTLQITAMPVVQFTANKAEGCRPVQVTFTPQITAQGPVTSSWNLGNGTTQPGGQSITVTYDEPGCYDVSLTVTANAQCSTTVSQNDVVCVRPVPVAAFDHNPLQVYSDDPVVDFYNHSSNNDFNHWNFGDGTTDNSENPKHTFPGVDRDYTVSLRVTTGFGCSDSTSAVVSVKNRLMYFVPNAFTPRNGDQINGSFTPVMSGGVDPDNYLLQIYDRWGELLFETRDMYMGWNGTVNGRPSKSDVYVWKLQFGTLYSGDEKLVVGHVTLVE